MKIVLCHNYYRVRGGEDQVFEDECELLRSRGHQVRTLTRHNRDLDQKSSLQIAAEAIWNRQTCQEIKELAEEFRPDVAHFTNTFPSLSPAAYRAFSRSGVPVIQSLHNYRLICPGSLLMLNDQFCDKCVGRTFAWQSIRNRCYRNSCTSTAVVAAVNTFHKTIRTWDRNVAKYVALSDFSRKQFVRGGLPADRLVIKPNFVLRPPRPVVSADSNYCVFAGRLSHEKGIFVLLEAWRRLADPSIELRIMGGGDVDTGTIEAAATGSNIRFLGEVDNDEVMRQIAGARVALIPSLSVETFGRVVIEAYSVATPVIASNTGAIAENVLDGKTGWLVPAGDVESLVESIRRCLANRDEVAAAGQAALQRFTDRFSADANYSALIDIYESAIGLEEESPAASAVLSPALPGVPGSSASSLTMNGHPQGDSNPATAESGQWPRKVNLFGLEVSVTDYDAAVEAIRISALRRQPAQVSCHAAHAVVEFTNSPSLSDRLNQFDMITPDGQPVRWAMNLLHRAGLSDRVYGPELMLRTCRMAEEEGLGIFLYGGSETTIDLLSRSLKQKFPGLQIRGAESPPFRELSADEVSAYIDQINQSGAAILFIGLGCPKQDLFASENRDRINAVQMCVGAAFDFHAGRKPIAPRWMQRAGLEWAFRLACEPRRLAGRYLRTNTVFIWRVFKQLFSGKPRRTRGTP
ncbi:MAG: WecB/TagA/CpsF family glycosyltransferase [Planctomycetota bacterium]